MDILFEIQLLTNLNKKFHLFYYNEMNSGILLVRRDVDSVRRIALLAIFSSFVLQMFKYFKKQSILESPKASTDIIL